MRRLSLQWLVLLLCSAGFVVAVANLKQVPRADVSAEVRVALPLFVQVGMSGGDRYMASNLATIRALITDTARMSPGEYRMLAKVQQDAAWLNPANQDNYYIAAAILPWNGELAAAQDILLKAAQSRPYDYQPAFLHAFNIYYFQQKPLQASEWLRKAAAKLDGDEENRLVMENLAAKWADQGHDLDTAINIVTALAKQAKRRDFRAYLELRVARLKDLKKLRTAADVFRQKEGHPIRSLDDLIRRGMIEVVPKDPFGFGYTVDAEGQVQFRKAGS